jgi:Tol biopolymer transport system component
MARALLVLFVCACNSLYELEDTRVLLDARPCTGGTSFGAPMRVEIDPFYSVEAARFTRNRGVAYLSLCPVGTANPKPGCDIYTSVYSAETEAFSAFSRMGGVSTQNVYDAYPTITNDNNHLLFGSERNGGIRIFIASVRNSSFDSATITQLPLPGDPAANEPYIVGDGRVLYLSTSGGANAKLMRMAGEPPLFGGQPRVVEGVDVPNSEEFAPVVRDDELEIFFASGSGGTSALDLYVASRANASATFGTPEKLALSTSAIEWPVWIAPNGCDLYFISKQSGVATLYVAKR